MKLLCIYFKNLWNEFLLSMKIVLWTRLNLLFFISSPIIALGIHFQRLNEASCFVLAGLALIPCAERLSLVTEHIAERTNGTIGSLLNATFGNAPELLISSAALRSGFYRLVQLTLLGSILTNLMFVFGFSSLIGGLKWQRQRIRITSGNVLIGMLFVALIGLVLPCTLKLANESSGSMVIHSYRNEMYSSSSNNTTTTNHTHDSLDTILTTSELQFSRINAFIMIVSYILFILFQLGTHKEEFDYTGDEYAVFGGGHNIVRVPSLQPTTTTTTAGIHTPHYHHPSEAQYNIFCLDFGFRSCFALCDRDLKFSHTLHTRMLNDTTSTSTNTTSTSTTAHTVTNSDVHLTEGGGVKEIVCQAPTSLKGGERLYRRSPSKSRLLYDRLSVTSMSVTSPSEESKYNDEKKGGRTFLDSPSFHDDEEKVILEHGHHSVIYNNKNDDNNNNNNSVSIESKDNDDDDEEEEKGTIDTEGPFMSLRIALLWLWLITFAISSLSDVIVNSIDGFAHRSNLSEVFISVIIMPFISNIAEMVSALIFGYRNKMDLCIGVTVGSAAQVALFILPGTVLVGWYMDRPMSLYFRGFETVCFLLSVICVGSVLQGGSTNWLSGLIFVCIYLMIASGFSFHEDERLSWETHIAHNNTRNIQGMN